MHIAAAISRAVRTWLLAAMLATAPGVAGAQMTGALLPDMALVGNALSAAVAAAGTGDADAAFVAMESLYRQWRSFRAMHFDEPTGDEAFLSDMERVDELLFAASQLLDRGSAAEAGVELKAAAAVLDSAVNRLQKN